MSVSVTRNQAQKNPDPEGPIRPTDEEFKAMLRSVTGKEQGPSLEQQSFVNWRALADQLGQPFDVERIPISKLRQMRRDPMIGFGLHYIKTPLVRAPWRIVAEDRKGPNAQIAAFVDYVLRPIYADFIFKYCLALDFGFQAMVKRFKFEFPNATYRDTREPESKLKPIWSEGNVAAITLKNFITLEPEKVEPVWKEKTGEFLGIDYENANAANLGNAFRAATTSGGKQKKANVDVYHALWATNEKASVFGSLFGYPRIAYAYRYWWSFWFNWAMRDRYIERSAVPPTRVYYPKGKYTDPVTQDEYDNQDLAIEAADAIRSGGIAALESDTVDVLNPEQGGLKSSNQRKWEIDYIKGGEMNINWAEEFGQLDVMKLRALWIPEQAFLEGEGGTSSRNVASQMAEIFIQSQTNLMAEIDDHINRFIIPQIVVLNFPEFEGKVTKVTTGFAQEDIDFLKQIIQLVGQNDPSQLGVDMQTALDRVGIPLLSPEQREQQRRELIETPQAPATAEPAPGGSVVPVPDENNALFGYSYINPPEQIILSDDEDFISDLPNIYPFRDKEARATALRFKKLWRTYYSGLQRDFKDHLRSDRGELALAQEQLELEVKDEALKLAKKIVDQWRAPAKVAKDMLVASQNLIKTVMKRGATVEAERIGARGQLEPEDVEEKSAERANFLMQETESTIRAELQTYLANKLSEGKNIDEIAADFEEHFADFPKWKSNRVARLEAQDAYNTGTLLAGLQAGVKTVQASDASEGQDLQTDQDCIDRNGNIYPIEKAITQVRPHHPNCTLFFKLVPPNINLSVKPLVAADGEVLADYNSETQTIYLSPDISREDAIEFKNSIVDFLVAENEDNTD